MDWVGWIVCFTLSLLLSNISRQSWLSEAAAESFLTSLTLDFLRLPFETSSSVLIFWSCHWNILISVDFLKLPLKHPHQSWFSEAATETFSSVLIFWNGHWNILIGPDFLKQHWNILISLDFLKRPLKHSDQSWFSEATTETLWSVLVFWGCHWNILISPDFLKLPLKHYDQSWSSEAATETSSPFLMIWSCVCQTSLLSLN